MVVTSASIAFALGGGWTINGKKNTENFVVGVTIAWVYVAEKRNTDGRRKVKLI